jgi:RimJ/RimL family protein N-acetyltransferase
VTEPAGRLRLDPIAPADFTGLAPIFADPAGWWYDPAGRHADPEVTRHFIERAAARWSRDGLSYWTVRLRDSGAIVGVGGAQRHATGAWNISYRIATPQWGNGYATELGRAAIIAARAHDDSVACIAWVDEHNHPSRRVAERLGLIDRGLHVDRNDGATRIAYADRPLSPADVAGPPAAG